MGTLLVSPLPQILFQMFQVCWAARPGSSWCDLSAWYVSVVYSNNSTVPRSYCWASVILACWPPILACLCSEWQNMMEATILKDGIGVRLLGHRMERNFRQCLVFPNIFAWIGFKYHIALPSLFSICWKDLYSPV